jgi:hypothetical protein
VVAAAGIRESTFWSYAIPLSPAFTDVRKLARMVLYRCLDAEASRSDFVEQLQRALEQLQHEYEHHFPNLEQDLTLRSGPLREAWEARGPGLLGGIGTETDPRLIARKADCLLVLPVAGGGGQPHWMYNSVKFEAMLANPQQELPEVVRLAWLLAQLNSELPMFAEAIPSNHLATLAATSLLLPTLSAAASVELVRFEEDLLAFAIEKWHITSPAADLAAALTQWWNAYVQTRPPWDVAILELDKLLFPAEANGEHETAD